MGKLNKKISNKTTLSLYSKSFTVVSFCSKYKLNINSFRKFLRGTFKSKKLEDILKKEGIEYEL